MAGTDVMCRMAFRYCWVCLVSYSINMLSAIYMKMSNWHWPDIRKRDTFCRSHILANPIQVMACNLWRQSHETKSTGAPFIPLCLPDSGGLITHDQAPGSPLPHISHSAVALSLMSTVTGSNRWPLLVCLSKQAGGHKQIKLRDGWKEKLMKFGNWKHYRQCM